MDPWTPIPPVLGAPFTYGLDSGHQVSSVVTDRAPVPGSMVFTVMAALAQMELEIKRERITDSVAKRRVAGKDLGGRRQTFADSQIRNALRLIEGGEPATQVARDLGMSRATLYRRIRELPQAMAI